MRDALCSGLDDADKELLQNNRQERNHIEDEIRELRERNVSLSVSYICIFLLLPRLIALSIYHSHHS